MPSNLPRDDFGSPIPAMGYVDDGAHTVTVAGNSLSNVTPFSDSTKVITVTASAEVRFKLGSKDVVANGTSHYLVAGYPIDIALNDARHIAFFGTATVNISERK